MVRRKLRSFYSRWRYEYVWHWCCFDYVFSEIRRNNVADDGVENDLSFALLFDEEYFLLACAKMYDIIGFTHFALSFRFLEFYNLHYQAFNVNGKLDYPKCKCKHMQLKEVAFTNIEWPFSVYLKPIECW